MKSLMFLVLVLLAPVSHATFNCNVSITKVLVYSSGAVNVLHTGRGDYTFICNLKEERDGVSIATCAMWTSMLQSIKKHNGQAAFYFNGDGSCSTLPTYASSPTPVYIGDI